jgi:hypothetical protein
MIIDNLLQSINYDIRIHKDARFMDQNVHLILVCIIALYNKFRESEPNKVYRSRHGTHNTLSKNVKKVLTNHQPQKKKRI